MMTRLEEGIKAAMVDTGRAMASIYILTVSTDEASADWYFTTKEKAVDFIKDNFSFDNPRKITSEHYQGIHHVYIIDNQVIDQRFAVAP